MKLKDDRKNINNEAIIKKHMEFVDWIKIKDMFLDILK